MALGLIKKLLKKLVDFMEAGLQSIVVAIGLIKMLLMWLLLLTVDSCGHRFDKYVVDVVAVVNSR